MGLREEKGSEEKGERALRNGMDEQNHVSVCTH